jgi:hypothetical protein
MTKKASKLINENVIRRWGKLANMPSLTENFIDSLEEDDAMEDEMAAAEDEVAAGEDEMEAGMEAEASVEEQEAVENIVQAVVDAISAETGVEIEVEGGADDEEAMDDMDMGMDASDEMDNLADDEEDAADAAAMRDMAYNRTDEKQGYDDREDEADSDRLGKKPKDISKKGRRDDVRGRWDTRDKGRAAGKKKDTRAATNRTDEELELEVIDDEALTEAVLSRVVERLLKKS